MAYQRRIAGIVHRAIEGGHRVEVVDKETMRDFDNICRADAGGGRRREELRRLQIAP